MADLLYYTKQIAQKIKYFDALVDFTDESHWYNPFYRQNEFTIIWAEIPDDD